MVAFAAAVIAILFVLYLFALALPPRAGSEATTPVRPVVPTCQTVPATAWNKQLRAKRHYTGKLDRKKITHRPVCKRKYLRLKGQVRTLKRREARRLETDPHYAIPRAFRDAGIAWRIPEATTVARCESTFNRFAKNGQYWGLFQLSADHRSRMRGTWSHAYDNAYHAAITVRADGDWGQWSCRP